MLPANLSRASNPAGQRPAALRARTMDRAFEREALRLSRETPAPVAQWSLSMMRPSPSLKAAPAQTSAPVVLQRQPAQQKDPKILTDFAARFPEAAKLIKASPDAMALIADAASAGVVYGGYSEDGPGKKEEGSRPYTNGNAVYIPGKADPKKKDGLPAMRDFLFELNNAVRAPQFEALGKAASKGKKSDEAAAKQYAYKNAELEVEGMLRLGKIWFEMKKAQGKGAKAWDQYDEFFFLAEYQAFQAKKKTKDQIVQETLHRKYEGGPLTGKTPEELYIQHYKEIAGD